MAVKIPLGDWDEWSDPEAIKEFEDEASKLQSIRHPNLVTFYGAGESEAMPGLGEGGGWGLVGCSLGYGLMVVR